MTFLVEKQVIFVRGIMKVKLGPTLLRLRLQTQLHSSKACLL